MSSAVPLPMSSDRRSFVVIIGVDPHKRTHTASALEPRHPSGRSRRCRSTPSLAGYRQLVRWAARFEDRRWAVENARGLGRHLAQWLVARGEQVDDVPSHRDRAGAGALPRRAPQERRDRRRRGGERGRAAGDATPIPVEDLTTVLALLDERRANLAAQRTRLVNQLHALLRDLVPGGADTDLTAAGAARGPRRRCDRPGRSRRRASSSPGTWSPRCARSTPAWPSCPTQMSTDGRRARQPAAPRWTASARSSPPGCSAAPAAPAGSPPRRRSPTTPASPRSRWPAPTGPGTGCPAAGTGSSTWRCTSSRSPRSACARSTGRAYYDRKIAEGKTHNEAMRCLKRRLADHVWRIMIADERPCRRRAREDTRGRL